MNDETMRESGERFQRWFDAMGLRPKCLACGKQDWKLIGDFYLPTVSSSGKEGAMARPLMCDGCGYLMLFAAQTPDPGASS